MLTTMLAQCLCGYQWAVPHPLAGLDAGARIATFATAVSCSSTGISLPASAPAHEHTAGTPARAWVLVPARQLATGLDADGIAQVAADRWNAPATIDGQVIAAVDIPGAWVGCRPHHGGAPLLHWGIGREGAPRSSVRLVAPVGDPDVKAALTLLETGQWPQVELASSLHGADFVHPVPRMPLARAMLTAQLAFAARATYRLAR